MPPDKLKQILRDNIRARRAEEGITQAKLASILGTSQAAIAQIERGHSSLSLDMLAKIADALHTQPALLLTPDAFVFSETAA